METLRLFSQSGGDWVIYLLIVASVVSLAVILERIYALYFKARGLQDRLRVGVRTSVLALERRSLEKRLIVLGTLANTAPFIGLLGTVLGIIRAFSDLARNPQGGSETVMQGLSEALIATAVGIMVAIPCAAAYNVLKKRVRDMLIDAEHVLEE